MCADAVGIIDGGAQLGALGGQDDLQDAVDAGGRVLVVQICACEGCEEVLRNYLEGS